MNIQSTPRWDREITLVSQLAAAASLLSFLFYFRHGDLLLYGDAVAHINIARRVIDSRTPGLLQLGTVWLPLPHMLMIPFLLSDAAWQTGIAGAVPSMCAYVFGTVGIFRLVRDGLSAAASRLMPVGAPALHARAAAWIAAGMFAANPNLLYMQTTAMTEVLYLAFFVWSVVHFSEFVQTVNTEAKAGVHDSYVSLMKCGGCLLAACLTRYDGWFLAAVITLSAARAIVKSKQSMLRRGLLKFFLLAVLGPVVWLGYNAMIYRNPLEFANGPYSARAIEQQKTALTQSSPHPGWHSLPVSFNYFLKSAEDNMAEGKLQKCWVALLIIGIGLILKRKIWPLLLLFLPVVFYTLSIAYGSVPIYVPDWWPFSYYNVRFGLELLPAFAVLTAAVMHFFLSFGSIHVLNPTSAQEQSGTAKSPPGDERHLGQWLAVWAVTICIIALLGFSYGLIWNAQPICYREAWINSRTRIAFETGLAATLIKLPHDSELLMYLGDHVGALQDAGIPLRRTINEGNHRTWKKPSDPEGLWERALADPRKYVDYVIAIDEDPVAAQVQRRDLSSMVVVHTNGQPPATIYWTHRFPGNQAR
jgi:hypothetical protein